MWLVFILFVLHALVFGSVIALERRQPTAALAWILTVVALPGLGACLWLIFGRRRIYRRKLKRRAMRNALLERVPVPQLRAFVPAAAGSTGSFLVDSLVRLGQNTARSPVTGANRVTIFERPAAAFSQIEHAIRSAKAHVHLLYYIFQGDSVGARIRDALIERAREGVTIRCLFDGLGSYSLTDEFLAPLIAAGAEIQWFLPVRLSRLLRTGPARPDLRNHRKIVVVDGVTGFTGGLNVGEKFAGMPGAPAWRDTHLRIDGPAVWELQRIFVEDWEFASDGERLDLDGLFCPMEPRGNDRVQILDSGPDTDWQIIHQLCFQAIANARHRVYLTTPYFVPGPPLLMALQTAALRGVDVRLLVPQRSDVRIVLWAGRSYYAELLAAGVRIYEYLPRILHAKTMTVDGEVATIGSANMDVRSFELNFEANAFIYSRRVAAQLEASFFADIAQSAPILPGSFARRPLHRRFAEGWARLWSPLL